MLRSRFDRSRNFSDITEAISAQRRALELTPSGHFLLPGRLSDLGNSLNARFQSTGDLSDITEAIATQEKAVKLTPDSDSSLPWRLSNLGIALILRFERTGDLSDSSRAISALELARDMIPVGHPNLPSLLSNLGRTLEVHFDRTWDPSDLAKCISARQKVVELTPEDDEEMPSLLLDLGATFRRRFEQVGNPTDSDEAITLQLKAVELTPEGHAGLPHRLDAVGNALSARFDMTRERSYIDAAISKQQKAVKLTPRNDPSFPGRLINLGTSFMRRFEMTKSPSDIDNAIAAQTKAVELSPNDPVLSTMLGNLAVSLMCRFEQTGSASDLAAAEAAHQRSVDLIPDGHGSQFALLRNIANASYIRFNKSGDSRDLEKCISQYESAATCRVGTPYLKLKVAARWARLLRRHCPHSPQILPAFDMALGFVALIAGLEQTVKGRYTRLQSDSGIALEAAAAACSLDRPDKALEFLEHGRCLVWSQLNNLRTPLDELRIVDSSLADRIADISKQLEYTGSSRATAHISMSLSERIALEDESQSHLKLAQQWDDLLQTARAIPGFENFLKPSPSSTLLHHLPASGPIIVINVDEGRCDAIALLSGVDEPFHIPLPNFSLNKAKKYRTDLKILLRSGGFRLREKEASTVLADEPAARPIKPLNRARRDGDVIHGILRGLWNDVVKPILDALGFSVHPTSTEVLPRIWWCPTGAMSFLPLHAAGIYTGSKSESILDYAVSSYTPTVTAISNRVKNHRAIDKSVSGLFMTSQPNAPGATSIPGTTKEVDSIHSMGRGNGKRVLRLDGGDVTASDCLKHMENYSSVHLACHASQDAADPLQSRFLLHNGSLDLATILQSNLKNADLAFLSACQTSTGEEKLSDEAVHLAAGMLAAGYRRVVATMWSIGDQPAQEVASSFYNYLWSHSDGNRDDGFDGTRSAYALHHAVQQLRHRLDNSESSLLTWVPYVHFGY
ncbi:CHAT domain-containing protein [Ephemerocybe angulata]|uniref:CHAT domain-containing protein n=1 Tax=Ephemerocybe angulata TaxID=980116 RepID=A0A8H6H9N8_9AGAR|nr:CHAT domain-containing protein [Tulosesus angulatus]